MIRYRAGWLIPQQLLALTHFHPQVTPEDFAQITQDTDVALTQAAGAFHLLLDNRIIADANLATLDTMLQMMPQMNHPLLRWVVMILPESLAGTAVSLPDQQYNQIRLTHVDTLTAAYDFLRSVDKTLNWQKLNDDFFTPQDLHNLV